ncbi:hypothetical protein HD600_002687 [Microbacterium ginsengiterrae]|uniref:Uncharacterized protein n=1 Tax=Microbacterium ginsengiterrae TaxID=546115 RepID=A0A7W9FCH3_9MICO|nr:MULTISPECIES: hypothetical protein [Microbacterium]MBB5744190.1 hypothetical protein [Microbacterium ginsengiterrae]
MVNTTNPQDDDRETVIGIDPDMNIGDQDPAAAESAEEDEDEDGDVALADLP